MKDWEVKAKQLLQESLAPVPHELNELDWKSRLSENTARLAQHLSAFSNLSGGGFLVFGIDSNGKLQGLAQRDCAKIIEIIGNIARDKLEPSVWVDHRILSFNNADLLFVYVPESQDKPVHLKGKSINDSYIRSSGQTRRMNKQEIKRAILLASDCRFEEGLSQTRVSPDIILRNLDYPAYFELLDKNLPDNKNAILDALLAERLIRKEHDLYHITNLGAILFAKNLEHFGSLARKSVRVIIYEGTNRLKPIKEQEGKNLNRLSAN